MSEATQTEEHRMSDEITDSSQTVAAGQLRALIERIEMLEAGKAETADEIKLVYSEAKGAGFQIPAIRELVKLRKKDAAEREEAQSILELYMQSIGMV